MRALTNEDRQALVVDNIRFAGWYAMKYVRSGVELEDLEQEANLGLCEAARRFDPAQHGAKFITYAGFWVRKYLMIACAKASLFPALVNFEPEDLVGDDPNPDLDERAKLLLWETIATLPVRDQTILVRRRGLDGQEPWTVSETASHLRMSAHLVRRSLHRSLSVVADSLISA